jgi:hypothetical protein
MLPKNIYIYKRLTDELERGWMAWEGDNTFHGTKHG